MARDIFTDTNPRFLAVDLARQLLPGMFAIDGVKLPSPASARRRGTRAEFARQAAKLEAAAATMADRWIAFTQELT